MPLYWIVGGAVALGAYLMLRRFHTVGGVEHFTKHGHDAAMKFLHGASVAPSTQLLPGAVVLEVVAIDPAGVSADGAVNGAVATGSAVLLTKNCLAADGQPCRMAITTGDVAAHTAVPGGPWAVLAPLA